MSAAQKPYGNGSLAMRVLESALSPSLKFTATVLALHANDAGYRIWPSVDRLAWLMGVSTRKVQRELAGLRAEGVIIPLTPLQRGRGRTVRYQLQLPLKLNRPGWQELTRESLARLEKGDGVVTHSEPRGEVLTESVTAETERVTAQGNRVTTEARKGDAAVTRSLQEYSKEKTEKGNALAARAAPAPAEPAPAPRSFYEMVMQSNPAFAKSLKSFPR